MNIKIDDNALPPYCEASLVIPVVLDANGVICEVLLARKARRIGVGKWNGFGGLYELDDRDKVSGALRELKEEIGIVAEPSDMWHAAILNICTEGAAGRTPTICMVYVYIAYSRQDVPLIVRTNEVSNPTWFSVDYVPLSQMMPADEHWLPHVLEGKYVLATFNYNIDRSALTEEPYVNIVEDYRYLDPHAFTF